MILNIPNILSSQSIDTILGSLSEAGPSIWKDGTTSAYGAAEKVKKNLQCDPDHSAVHGILEKAHSSLLKNSAFVSATQPDKFSRMMINAYQVGMSYGDHLDATYIRDLRTDVSFTIFLTPPTSYEGGELVVTTPFCEMAVKGEQGSVFLYPSTYLHRVEQVTSGNRIAIVGWLRSRILHPHHRELLFNLDQTISDLGEDNSHHENYMRLHSIKNRLLREWS